MNESKPTTSSSSFRSSRGDDVVIIARVSVRICCMVSPILHSVFARQIARNVMRNVVSRGGRGSGGVSRGMGYGFTELD